MTNDTKRTFEVPVQENRRMILPLDLRRRLGLNRGGRLVIEAGEAGIMLTTARARRRRAQEIARKYADRGEGSVVEEFIAEKREAARREAEEIEGAEEWGAPRDGLRDRQLGHPDLRVCRAGGGSDVGLAGPRCGRLHRDPAGLVALPHFGDGKVDQSGHEFAPPFGQ